MSARAAADFHPETLIALLTREVDRLYEDTDTWSMQGFGMARMYLPSTDDAESVRLNVWHTALRTPGLSPLTGMVHTHPWDFTSRVIAGELTNVLYLPAPSGDLYVRSEITPGPGGDFTGPDGFAERPSGYPDRDSATLRSIARTYGPGESYSQTFTQIHHTEYVDGTVTLNRRRREGRPDRAFTLWANGHKWVSAEPRVATLDALTVALTAAIVLLGGDR